MDYDYSKRSYLLPEGCKDLIDVIQPKTAITEQGFVAVVILPDLQNGDIEITAEGRTLHIVARQSGTFPPLTKAVDVPVPSDYALEEARATYMYGCLHIVVPKTEANSDEYEDEYEDEDTG